jgi:hypothetical protein
VAAIDKMANTGSVRANEKIAWVKDEYWDSKEGAWFLARCH